MTPIPPVAPLESAITLATRGPTATTQPVASPEMVEKFRALMQHDPQAADGTQGPNAVASVIQGQQNEINQMQGAMIDFVEKAPSMDPSDRFIAGAELMQKESLVHMKMSVAMGLAKSSSKSLQTLIKNE
jgi:type III secretion system HrpB2-like protein